MAIKLHEIPRGSKILVDTIIDGKVMFTMHHTDGMYSYCTDDKGHIEHLSVMTPLKLVDDHYEIDG